MAQPKIVETAEEFFAVAKKSRLLHSEQLDKARAAHEESSDPRDVAKYLIRHGWITKWQAGQLLAGWYGLRIGKYTLLEQVGKGEMGRVFLAEHTQMRRRALVKTLSRRHTQQPDRVDQFLAEASQAAALDHRNIVQVYDVSRERDRHYLVMEYVEGDDWESIVAQHGPLPFAEAADYVAQAASGLAHAHNRAMIHRSLKPASLMVDQRGVVKILDMGLGCLKESASGAVEDASSAALASEASFLAPEQLDPDRPVDRRADIYSLGGAMYFLLTGRAPTQPAVEEPREEDEEARQLLDARPDVPPELVGICRKMMAARPQDRYQSADEVVRLLEKWLIEHPPADADAARPEGDAAASEAAPVDEESALAPVGEPGRPAEAPGGPPADASGKPASMTPARSGWRAAPMVAAGAGVLLVLAVLALLINALR